MNEFLAWVTGVIALVIPGFGSEPAPSWNGYIEADYVYVAVASPGTIEALPVREGDAVERGTLLFTLDGEQHRALVAAAEARVLAAQANLENLTTGSREAEEFFLELP